MLEKNKKGSALVVALFILAIILISALSITLITVKERLASIGSAGSNRAYQASETGIESVMQEIIKGNHEYINNGTNSLRDSLQSASFICNASGVLNKEDYSVQFLDSTPEQIDCDDPSRPVSDIVKIKSVGESSNSKRAVEALVSNKSTKLLMHFDELPFGDSSYSYVAYNISNEGVVTLDTDKKLGSNSAKFSGSNYIKVEDTGNINFNFTDKDFTIESWVKFDSLLAGTWPALVFKCDKNEESKCPFWFNYEVDEKILSFGYSDGSSWNVIDDTVSFTPTSGASGDWYHIVFERKGAKGYFFINGVRHDGSEDFSNDTIFTYDASPLVIGAYLNDGSIDTGYEFIGKMDELRITKGLARYPTDSDFNPWEDVEYVPNI